MFIVTYVCHELESFGVAGVGTTAAAAKADAQRSVIAWSKEIPGCTYDPDDIQIEWTSNEFGSVQLCVDHEFRLEEK